MPQRHGQTDRRTENIVQQMAGSKTKINNQILLRRNPSFGETLDQVHSSWRSNDVEKWQNMMSMSYG